MTLSDREISIEIAAGRLSVSPLGENAIQPASLDVRLGTKFAHFGHYPQVIDPARRDMGYMVHFEADCHVLRPGGFCLGTTMETVKIPDDIAAKFEGKSSLGRIGLMTHVTAGFIDPGFCGEITLELFNATENEVVLRAGMFVGQLCFTRLTSPAIRPYGSLGLGSHYQDQSGATSAR